MAFAKQRIWARLFFVLGNCLDVEYAYMFVSRLSILIFFGETLSKVFLETLQARRKYIERKGQAQGTPHTVYAQDVEQRSVHAYRYVSERCHCCTCRIPYARRILLAAARGIGCVRVCMPQGEGGCRFASYARIRVSQEYLFWDLYWGVSTVSSVVRKGWLFASRFQMGPTWMLFGTLALIVGFGKK